MAAFPMQRISTTKRCGFWNAGASLGVQPKLPTSLPSPFRSRNSEGSSSK